MVDHPIHAASTGVGLWLQQHAKRGSWVADVGANVGEYTALAADLVGSQGRVFAFEPAPMNATRLRSRFEGVPQVTVIEAAVGEQSRNVRLYLDAENDAQHSLGSHNVGRAGGALKVRQVALDDVADIEHVDLLKIDAQGAECRILEGAGHLLARSRPLVALEFWPYGLRRLRSDPEELLQRLKEMGYVLYRLSAKGCLKGEDRIRAVLSENTRWKKINVAAFPLERSQVQGVTVR